MLFARSKFKSAHSQDEIDVSELTRTHAYTHIVWFDLSEGERARRGATALAGS